MASADRSVVAGRKPYLAGNWKMNGTRAVLRSYLQAFAGSSSWQAALEGRLELALYLPATLVPEAAALAGPVQVGGQTLNPEEKGAFTGELSAQHWLDAGASSVLVGHSERRTLFAETDTAVAARLGAALGAGLKPVLCVGENLAERQAGAAESRVQAQLAACREVLLEAAVEVIVAYEPVWAIGTGETATPAIAQRMHEFIRGWFAKALSTGAATRILYGGSVTADNAAELLGQPDVDGALVGGASLTAESFSAIGAALLE